MANALLSHLFSSSIRTFQLDRQYNVLPRLRHLLLQEMLERRELWGVEDDVVIRREVSLDLVDYWVGVNRDEDGGRSGKREEEMMAVGTISRHVSTGSDVNGGCDYRVRHSADGRPRSRHRRR